jgi:hypothetical protein
LLQATGAKQLDCLRCLHGMGDSLSVVDECRHGVITRASQLGLGQSESAGKAIIGHAIDSGLDINQKDAWGQTALDFARMGSETGMVEFLTNLGGSTGAFWGDI